MSPSRKKVIVRRQDGDFLAGYLAPTGFVRRVPLQPDADLLIALDLLDLEGRSVNVTLDTVRMICFVREFNRDDLENPERLSRRSFLSRPREEGLWLRLAFLDGGMLEGLAAADLTMVDGLIEDAGFFLTPPDERENTHRIYVPRGAIESMEVLGVIGKSQRKAGVKRGTVRDADQATLFED